MSSSCCQCGNQIDALFGDFSSSSTSKETASYYQSSALIMYFYPCYGERKNTILCVKKMTNTEKSKTCVYVVRKTMPTKECD